MTAATEHIPARVPMHDLRQLQQAAPKASAPQVLPPPGVDRALLERTLAGLKRL